MQSPFDLVYPAQANGAGTAVVGPVGPGSAIETWVVEQLSVSGVAPNALAHAIAVVTVNGSFKLGSRTGESDTASQDPPITLGPGEILTCTWTGLQASTPCQLRISGHRQFPD